MPASTAAVLDTAPARPFVKWVGGKRQLLGAIEPLVPKRFGTYFEPFVGGGALFYHLGHRPAVLSDANERLIRTYQGVRDACEEVIDRLANHQRAHDKAHFLKTREQPIDEESPAAVAAWFIYLNRTGFNGLYRVNSKNRFNVPFGDYKNPTICDADNLRACSRALAGVELHVEPFDAVLDRANAGDFVYFDPPYVPLSVTSSFTSYTRDKFDMPAQVRLRDVARKLGENGVHVLLSNSAAPAVRELYADFEQHEVLASRSINSKGDGRGAIAELLIRWQSPARASSIGVR